MAKFQKKSAYVDQAQAEPIVSIPVITDDDLLDPSGPPSDEEPTRESIEAEVRTMNEVAAVVPAGGLMMTAADIASIVQVAVQAALATQQAGNKGIGEEIANALKEHKGIRPRTVAEIGEPDTPFNPGKKKRELKHDFYQNYFFLHERMLHDNEIDMLHQLVPGTYGPSDFPINVIERSRTDGGKKRVYIVYPDGKNDRLRAKNYGVNFHATLVHLVEDAKTQRAEKKAAARAYLAED